MQNIFSVSLIITLLLLINNKPILACTSILVTKGASQNGATMVSYSADSHTLYGELYYYPRTSYPDTATIPIYCWDTGLKINAQIYTGTIQQVKSTLQVVGNMNEKQVVIAETTFGGRHELIDSLGVLDYGNLIYITLQRANTARQAITILTNLANQYGYNSSGESLSIADANEVWYLELIGKGINNKGIVWVALKVPNGYVAAHANQARIRKFNLTDTSNCLYASNVIDFARQKGYYQGPDSLFSFADAYAPLDFEALRFCEARVYSIYKRCAPNYIFNTSYILGNSNAPMLPLFIKPENKLNLQNVMALMRNHCEGTELDMTTDVGAGPFACPYRWRPLTWSADSVKYFNERAISTQQTAFSFVSQSRAWLPNPIGGVLWFGVDDTYSTVYSPFYCCINNIPQNYKVGNGNMLKYSPTSAFWLFNKVANLAYTRYNDIIIDIKKVQLKLESQYIANQDSVDNAALLLYNPKKPNKTINYLTNYSQQTAQQTFNQWQNLYEYLTIKYIDGNIKTDDGQLLQPGYPQWWYKLIIEKTGEKYKVQ